MKFFCDQCNAQYMIADEKVGPKGVKVKCKKCSNLITVKPQLAGDATTVDQRPAPAKEPVQSSRTTETGEISGAFDSLFSGEEKNSNTWGNQASPAASASASGAGAAAPAGEKEWYVAIDDAQVGPIDLAEMTQRWDAKEINEDSLAWKGGMPDWVAIADIPDLQHLVKERPQKKSGGASATVASSTVGQAAAAKSAASIEWKPSAASALSSLVQEELIAAKAPKEEPKRPEGLPDLGSGFGNNDLFGGKVGGASAPANEGFGAHSDANWSVPSGRPTASREGGIKAVHILGAVGGLVVLGILGVLGMMVMKMQQPPPQQVAMAPQTTPAAHPTPAPPAPAPTAPTPTTTPAPSQPTPPAATPAPADKHADDEDESETDKTSGRHKGKKHKERGGGGGRDEPAARSPGGAASAPPPPAPPPAAAVKASLSKEDIWGVVRANAARVGPCLKAARGRNEIPAGSYTFILNWTIRPDGAVQGSQLTGPANVLSSSIPGCFASVVGQWHFPASQAGAPIRNFPFGPVNVP